MSRSTNCIKMLLLLKARGFMSVEELATILDTNVRNIREYRKELEEAGYSIISTTGKYGGYQLDTSCLFPVTRLRAEEHQALLEALEYMKSKNDFLLLAQVQTAFDKILATTTMKKGDSGIYMQGDVHKINGMMKNFIMHLDEARKNHIVVDILYKGMHAKQFEKVRIHPYEILNDKGNYYCLAYSLKAKDYRHFKFSEERLKEVNLTNLHFDRDPDFKVQDYIGKKGLMANEVYDIDILLYKESALLVSEAMVGISPKGEWIDDETFHFQTMMEGKISVLRFLLSHGNQVKVLKPESLKKEMKEIIEDMFYEYHETT